MKKLAIHWMRRDLRLDDNHGLYRALSETSPVACLFIFDRNILDELPSADARVEFIHETLIDIKQQLKDHGSDLIVRYGHPEEVWKKLIKQYDITSVHTNHDYEPYAVDRDKAVEQILNKADISWHTYKDHVLFERDEILTNAGGIYTVFTPYKRKWLEAWETTYVKAKKNKNGSIYPSEDHLKNLATLDDGEMITLSEMGFEPTEIDIPSTEVKQGIIKNYAANRNFPGLEDSTSKLGIHFRFGTVSIRKKALKAASLSDIYLSELVWRDFYAQILANYPKVVDQSFKEQYDRIQWRNDESDFAKWKEGVTGYPIVDAGMRELNTTGYMHNRVRMVVASFLTKHLLIDWRWGEAYFAEKLLDFDLASNNGGWQWAAGSGTDAAPYFRVFNPTSQMEKFDKNLVYIKKWIPEYGTSKYPEPMVDHKFARERCLTTYKAGLSND